MVAYTGLDSIGETAAEARDPDRDLAPATNGALLGIVALGAAIALVAAMAMPYRTPRDAALPVLGVVSQVPLHVMASGLAYVIGLLVAALLVMLAHSVLTRSMRLVAWQAEHRQLAATRAPIVPVAAAAAGLAAIQGVLGGTSFLVGTSAFGSLAAIACLHAAVIALRFRDPGRYRPVAAPLNLPIGARRVPLVAILGALLATAGLAALVALEPGARYAGIAWMLAGLAAYAVYRRRQGLSLGERRRRAAVDHAGPGVEVEFRTMLIPVNTAGSTVPADLLDVAAQLAGERRASLVVLAFTEIPLGEEIDMEIDDLDAAVERLAAAARAVGDRYGIRVLTTHLRTRDPAEAILAEATRRDSQLILLRATGLERSEPRQRGYDQAVRRIVAEARQRVMIVRPEQAAT
jgi:APA family basic amino acid/polyamine antiporter